MARDVTIDRFEKNGETVSVKVGFQGFDQVPLLLVWKEYRDAKTKAVTFAEVLFKYDKQSEDKLQEEVLSLLGKGLVVDAIRYVRWVKNLGLKEAKEYVDKIRGV